ncbi:hypothetical protein [Lactococcus lactis]|uniref:hypothetical protein n=1 Tax=Lactococcus lactis TaxID=1358 RepID=UPI002905A93D|nr:hypothetical protein [Lactococcus lactis]
MTTGGLFSSPTLLALGMGPYMTVSILLSVGYFTNREVASQISQEMRGRLEIIGIFIMALLQSIPLAFNLRNSVISKSDSYLLLPSFSLPFYALWWGRYLFRGWQA